tara:strand:- start:168 stop:1730 length:1563 start_codon:yes stop_codon:yes gene_type:complete
MSSFEYTDNFSGFNDLINRSHFLTEAKKSPYAKYHSSFGGVTKDLRSAGFSSAPLDTINFIRTALYNLELISDDELSAAKKGAGFAAKKNNLLALLDAKEDVIEQNKDIIAKEIEDGLAQYINRATTNRGREEKYAAQKAALELAKDIKAGEDVGDAVEDTVGQLDAAEAELADSLQMSKEDPTTFIEIKIRDTERVEDVGNIVSKYANEDGLDISNDTVQFSVDPGTPLASAITTHGIDKIEAALKRDVDKISDSVVVVMSPDEDYEQIDDDEQEGPSLANSPGGAPSSYAAGEEGGGLTTPEDEESSIKLSLAGKEYFIGVDDPNDDGIITDIEKHQNGYMIYGGVFHDEQEFWDGEEPKEGYMYAIDFNGELMDEDDLVEAEAVGREIEDAEDLDHFLTKEQPEDYIPSTDYEDVLNDLVNKDKKEHAMKKLNGAAEMEFDERGFAKNTKAGTEDEEEAIKMQPMLESHKTDTSAYLTEQTASDKRNKKTEVKPQSFKEKYKPKTHWQLEELRRYGL